MSVQLDAVKLNHDPNSATSDAMNIRRNGSTFVTVPEWQRGISAKADDSPACYSIGDTQGQTLTIQAQLTRLDPSLQSVEVRAIDPSVEGERPGCLGAILRIIRIIIRGLVGNALGEVKARTISFGSSGQTGFETFELVNPRLWTAGVGARFTTWRWQYRVSSSDYWTDFATSSHKIYSVLQLPTAPWQQTPYYASNIQLPWADVLEYSCTWAILKATLDDAAAAITDRIYDLGPSVVTYDCPGGGSSHYSWGSFDCTAFLERLDGGTGNGQYVNCSDCATFVSTFANILGCDLWQSEMGYIFELNPLLAIGSGLWEPACASFGWSGLFSYHEVAWKGACTSNDRIYDACLMVDGDADPTSSPHTPLPVLNLRFGAPGDGDYRDRLATPAGRPNCEPQPSTRTRRMVV